MPLSSIGCSFLMPRIMCVDGLVKSKSNKPTAQFFLASVSARVVAMRLFPTPPLPLETAIMRWIGLSRRFIMLVRGSSICFYCAPFIVCSQIPLPVRMLKSGLLHFGHLM